VSELTHDDVQRILKIIDEMGDRDVHLEVGELKLHVTRNSTASIATAPRALAAPPPATAPKTAKIVTPAEIPPGHIAIRAPTMGMFYRASSPGAKPHAEVGDHVEPDDTVGVFEVMKLFSTLKAGINGTISAIPASNEAMVEQDQILVVIKPDR
jgi:acetyl-CoA carboxylase biotin carboxyl carrier protein